MLAEERERAGLSQRQLSVRLGMHPMTIGKIERGERRIDLVEFIDICEALGLEPGATLAKAAVTDRWSES